VSALLEGAGTTDLRKALKAVPKTVVDLASWGTGTGSLEAARGNFHVVVGGATTGETTLAGEVDVFGQAWDAATWAKQSRDRKAWHDGDWRGATLTAKGWQDVGGGRKAWVTASWNTSGTVVANGDWSARMWRDGTWSARMWRDSMWSARMWRGGFSSAGWF
jgi:serine protease AprX